MPNPNFESGQRLFVDMMAGRGNGLERNFYSLVGSWDGEVVTDASVSIPTSSSFYTLGENTVDRLLSTDGSIEEIDLVPNGW